MARLLKILTKCESICAAFSILLLAGLLLCDVISREVFSISLPWASKVSLHLMIFAGCLGVSLASSQGQQLRPEVGEYLFAEKTKNKMSFLRELIVATFCAFLTSLAFRYVNQTREFGDVHVVTHLPLWLIQLAFVLVFALLTVKHAIFAFFPPLRPNKQGTT